MIDISENHLAVVIDILKTHAPGCEARVFGSRRNGKAKKYSDLDIALVGENKISIDSMAALRGAFEDSDLPFRVDLLDWNTISNNFRANIAAGYDVLARTEPPDIKRLK